MKEAVKIRPGAESYSVSEAAVLLGISIPTLKRMESEGRLDGFRTPGGHLRISASSVEAVRERKTVRTRPAREPSPILQNRREHIEELVLQAQEVRAKRELARLEQEDEAEAEDEAEQAEALEMEAAAREARLDEEQQRQVQEDARQRARQAAERAVAAFRSRWLEEASRALLQPPCRAFNAAQRKELMDTAEAEIIRRCPADAPRMPYARRRKAPELNKAYAHVSSTDFVEAAKQLETSMIAMGFEDVEAAQYIEIEQPSIPHLPLFLQAEPLKMTLERMPETEGLSDRERDSIIVKELLPGHVQVEVHGEVTERIKDRLLDAMPHAERAEAAKAISDHLAAVAAHTSPSQRGELFTVPRLCARYQGELLLFDRELVLDAAGWNLLDYAPELGDFRFNDTSKTFEFDVDGSRVVYQFMGELQLDLNLLAGDWTPDELVRWLDKQLRQPDIGQEVLSAWLSKALRELLSVRGVDLAALVRAKYILTRKLEDRIKQCRMAAYSKGYQELLFGPNAAVETSYEYAFSYSPEFYPANWLYSGRHNFLKHFYPLPGELQSQGEEFDCAAALDAQSSVKHWVRNLSNQPQGSIWLQTATDRFYPDFVAELLDGRLLMLEYKGALTAQGDDSSEKRQLGELWEEKSNGKALFLIAVKRDAQGRNAYEQIRAKIEGH